MATRITSPGSPKRPHRSTRNRNLPSWRRERMNITLGVYDLFAYAAPGSLYLTLILYAADRLSWIDPLRLLQSNTAVIIISGAILSYLLGHITYPLGYMLSRAYGHDKSREDAKNDFVERVPTAKGR